MHYVQYESNSFSKSVISTHTVLSLTDIRKFLCWKTCIFSLLVFLVSLCTVPVLITLTFHYSWCTCVTSNERYTHSTSGAFSYMYMCICTL